MTENLAQLRQRRRELDYQIAEAERQGRERWNTALDLLDDAVRALAEARGLAAEQSSRKNVRTLVIGEVRIELGYIEEPWGAWLAVQRGALSIGFGADGDAPGPALFTAMLQALLDEETGS